MINLLIVENNAEQSKNIVNYISKICPDIRIFGIAYDDNDALEILSTDRVDAILIDLNLPGLGSYNVLNYIAEKRILKFLNSIIVLGGNNMPMTKLFNNKYIHCCLKKPISLDQISEKLKFLADLKMSESDEFIIKEKIRNQLEHLSYNFSYHGSKYLLDAIYLLYKNKDKFFDNLTRDIYPVLAEKHNKTANTIKCDITQATKVMFYDCSEKTIKEYFYYAKLARPTVKEVMFTVLNKIS